MKAELQIWRCPCDKSELPRDLTAFRIYLTPEEERRYQFSKRRVHFVKHKYFRNLERFRTRSQSTPSDYSKILSPIPELKKQLVNPIKINKRGAESVSTPGRHLILALIIITVHQVLHPDRSVFIGVLAYTWEI
ncbi:hypothetical protein J6590_015745 [Homalodisca vitripennis]|nr:hypothetical protein J6590_015745 [Homalodisca vitripennis]